MLERRLPYRDAVTGKPLMQPIAGGVGAEGAIGVIRTAFTVGSIIAAMMPKPRPVMPELKYSTTEFGRPLPIGYGTFQISGNLVWIGNFQQINPGGKGGKGGGGGKGKSNANQQPVYSVSFAMTWAEGCCSYRAIWQDNKVALQSGQTQQQLTNPGKSGKFKGTNPQPGSMTFYQGDGSNVCDPTISASLPGGAGATATRFPINTSPSGSSPQYTVANPPVVSGSDALYIVFATGVGEIGLSGQIVSLLVRVSGTPTYNQYAINDTTGVITFGPGYTDQNGVNQSWTGSVLVQGSYQSTVSGTAADALCEGYPYFCYSVFDNWVVGSAARVPNMRAELVRHLSGSSSQPQQMYGQVLSYNSLNGNAYLTQDGLSWGAFPNPPNGAGPQVCTCFWADENSIDAIGNVQRMAAINDGLYFTTNAGLSWVKSPTIPVGVDITQTDVKCAILRDGTLILWVQAWAAQDNGIPMRIYRSTNSGSSWTLVSLPNLQGDGTCGLTQGGTVGMGELVLDNSGNLLLAGVNFGGFNGSCGSRQIAVWRSTDSGASWATVLNQVDGVVALYAPNPYAAQLVYKRKPNGSETFFLTWSYSGTPWSVIWRSTDGIAWTVVLQLFNPPTPNQGDAIAATSTLPISGFRNNPGYCSDGSWLYFSRDGSNALHAWRSTDDGKTWTSQDSSLPTTGDGSASTLFCWAAADITSDVCVPCGTSPTAQAKTWASFWSQSSGGAGALYYSTDGGRTWTAFAGGPQLGTMFAPNLQSSQNVILDENPKNIFEDIITNTRYGGKWSDLYIDPTTFASAASYYQTNGILISPVIRDHKPILSHLEDLLVICDSWLVYNQGMVQLIPRQAPLSTIAITTASYTRDKEQVKVTRIGPDNLVNRCIVHYLQRSVLTTQFDANGNPLGSTPVTTAGASVTVDWYESLTQEARSGWLIQGDVGQAVIGGGRRSGRGTELMVGADGITRDDLASKVAYRVLWTRAFNRYQATLPLGPDHQSVQPTDVLNWTDEDLGLFNILMRVLSIDEDQDGRLSCECVEENPIFLGWGQQNGITSGITPGQGGSFPIFPAGAPVPAVTSIREMTPQEAQGNGSILALVGGTSTQFAGFLLYASRDNATYSLMAGGSGTPVGYLVDKLPFARDLDLWNTLHVKMLTTGITFVTTTDAEWRSGENAILIGDELIYFKTARLVAPDEWYLTGLFRGVLGTTPQAHVVNSVSWAVSKGETVVTPLQQSDGSLGGDVGVQPLFAVPVFLPMVGTTLYFKAATLNSGGGQQDLSTVTPTQITYQARGGRPIDPGDVAVVGYGSGDTSVEVG